MMFKDSIKIGVAIIFILSLRNSFAQGLEGEHVIVSPDKNIVVTCNPIKAIYRISYKGELALTDSKLGIVSVATVRPFDRRLTSTTIKAWLPRIPPGCDG